MARILRVAAAQSGPIQKEESREAVVVRLLELMKEASANGCDLVVFTELALTTFFPRYFEKDQTQMDGWFESEMPNSAVQPLFDYAIKHRIGFTLGYAEKPRRGDISIPAYWSIHLVPLPANIAKSTCQDTLNLNQSGAGNI